MHLKSLLTTKALIILTLIAVSFSGFAQAPNLLNYQGVARNSAGNPLPNQKMNLRLSVHNLTAEGTIVYSETRVIITNLGGLFFVQVGSAGTTSATGTIGGVIWLSGDKYLQVEIAPENNNNYLNLGTVQLVSVPYAFNAVTAANALTVTTNANLTGVVTSVGNATSITSGAITSDMIGTLNKSKVGLDLVNNTSDAAKPISTLTQAALGTKLNVADSTSAYVTPTQLAANKFDLTPITNAIAGKLAIADSTNSYVTPANLAAKAFDSTSISNRINLKANTSSLATVATSGSYNDLTNKPTVPNAYSLPTASSSALGGIKVGTGLSIDGNGLLSASSSNSASSLTGIVPIEKGGTSTTNVDGIKSLLGLNSLNVAIGVQSGTTNQASDAIAIGGGSGKNNQANATIAIGYVAGYDNQGSGSIAIGGNAGQGSQGHHSVAIGAAAGQNGQGAYSVAIGTFAGNVQAANSIALNATGTSLNTQTTGFFVDPIRNTTATSDVLYYNSTTKEITSAAAPSAGGSGIPYTGATGAVNLGNYDLTVNGLKVGKGGGNISTNTASGVSALLNNTTGNSNTALGYNTLYNNISGYFNTSNGLKALYSNTTGSHNIAIGVEALYSNIDGSFNNASGNYALYSNTSGIYNIGIGWASLYKNTTANNNTAIGYQSLRLNETGGYNTATGSNTLYSNTTGVKNTAVGESALITNTTGSNNTAIGYNADVASNSLYNATAIGYNSSVTASNTIQLGNTSVTKVNTSGTITAAALGLGVSSPNASALLEVSSTTKGFLPPRMTEVQRIAINSPVQGLMIYCTNCGANGEPEYYNGSSWVNLAGNATAAGIGSVYQGGILAYYLVFGDPGYDPTTPHGLIAASSDQSSSIIWWNGVYANPVTALAIGTGLANTNAIINSQGPTQTNYAAGIAQAYTIGSYSDWYLPSKDELNKLYLNRVAIGGFGSDIYWSSSAFNYSTTYVQNFGNGGMYNEFSNGSGIHVRAIRTF